MTSQINPSSGNVFLDLGFEPEEAAHLEVRSTLMFSIRKLIQDRGLTQAKAAELLGVSQPRVSNLVQGREERSDSRSRLASLQGLQVPLSEYVTVGTSY